MSRILTYVVLHPIYFSKTHLNISESRHFEVDPVASNIWQISWRVY